MRALYLILILSGMLSADMRMDMCDERAPHGEQCIHCGHMHCPKEMHMSKGLSLSGRKCWDCGLHLYFDVGLLYQKISINHLYFAKSVDLPTSGSSPPTNGGMPGQDKLLPRYTDLITTYLPQRGLKAFMGELDPEAGLRVELGVIMDSGWVGSLIYWNQSNSGSGAATVGGATAEARVGSTSSTWVYDPLPHISHPKIFTPKDIFIDRLVSTLYRNVQMDTAFDKMLGDTDDDTTSMVPEQVLIRREAVVKSEFFRPIIFYDDSSYDIKVDLHNMALRVEAPVYMAERVSMSPHCGIRFLWDSIEREVIFVGGSVIEIGKDGLGNQGTYQKDINGAMSLCRFNITRDSRASDNEDILYHDQYDDYFGGGLDGGVSLAFDASRNFSIFCDQSIGLLYGHHDIYDGLLLGTSRGEARRMGRFIELGRRVFGISPILHGVMGMEFRGSFMRSMVFSRLAFNVFHGWNQFYQLQLSYEYHRASNKIQVGLDDTGSLSMAGVLFNVGMEL